MVKTFAGGSKAVKLVNVFSPKVFYCNNYYVICAQDTPILKTNQGPMMIIEIMLALNPVQMQLYMSHSSALWILKLWSKISL